MLCLKTICLEITEKLQPKKVQSKRVSLKIFSEKAKFSYNHVIQHQKNSNFFSFSSYVIVFDSDTVSVTVMLVTTLC